MGKIVEAWKNFIEPRLYYGGRHMSKSYAIAILDDLCRIRSFCNEYKTCEGCPFKKEHVGCMFRGKTPREW